MARGLYNLGMTARTVFTQDMLKDLSAISDVEFSKKWGVSRKLIINFRKRNGIKPFRNQHGLREHKFIDGVEYKYCSGDGGHWEDITNFGKGNNRYDGVRGVCKKHESEISIRGYHKGGKEKAALWLKTENGRKYLRNTWRKEKAKKDNAFVKWDREDEERAYRIFKGCCGYCGIEVPFIEIEFDHFIPVAMGGKTEPKNMIPCCTLCNHGVGGKFKREPTEWVYSRFRDDPKRILKDIESKIKLILSEY